MKLQAKIVCFFFLMALKFSPGNLIAQTLNGRVVDSAGNPLSFATVKFGNSKQGIIANLDGKFSLSNQVTFIEVSHAGYTTQKVSILQGIKELVIILQPLQAGLEPVIIKASGNKLRRILNTAIANRSINNPDNYDWYQCNVYYKMAMDINDSIFFIQKNKGDSVKHRHKEIYFMLTETYSKRSWHRPAILSEKIIASRMAGFNKPVFTSLITDVLPFHVYSDFINLNGKDFYNPLSKGLYKRFKFTLSDEIEEENDTVWVINFSPKLDPSDLAGTLYISSDGFAIKHIVAHSLDADAKKDLGIEQQYIKYDGRWFPQQLNYILQWQLGKEDAVMVTVKGTSIVDSLTFKNDNNFKFDKAHTVQLLPHAEERRDSLWMKVRPMPLDEKEQQTYRELDSTFKKIKMEKLVFYGGKIMEGKFPAGKFDININRLYSYNDFEKNRLGFGLQTSEKISGRFSIGGWAGYGTGDKEWKYGAFAEAYGDRYKESIVNVSFYHDIRDPGRLQIHKDIDNNSLRSFLISRADRVEGWSLSVQKKFGYLTAEIAAGKEDIQPQYDYSFESDRRSYRSFSTHELTLKLRYAFGETSAPFLGKYYSSVTKYPVLYGRIITGKITNANINYTQAIAAITYTKNINRIGKERLLLSAGYTFNERSLPLSKLFAGNGFSRGGTLVYAFGAMETMLPYQFYSDRFINLYWLHQFNRPLFRLVIKKQLQVSPTPAFAYNALYGSLTDPAAHSNVVFSVPDKGYHEAAAMLNSLFRIKIFGLYYVTLNAGYFHNFPVAHTYADQGCFVYGIGVEL